MSSNASPSAEVTNLLTTCDTVKIPGSMDDQPGPHDDPMNVQSDEGQFGGFDSVAETEQEADWNFPLTVSLVSFFFGIAVAQSFL